MKSWFCPIQKVVSQQKAKNREQTLADRVPTMTISSTTTEAELRNFANDLYNKLKTTLGDVFDLDEQKKKNEYYVSTVKPVYSDHPRETRKGVFIGRWSLYIASFGTCFNEKPFSKETQDVVFVDRWSFYTGGH